MYVHMHTRSEVNLGCPSDTIVYLVFLFCFFFSQDWISHYLVPGIPLSRPPHCWDYKCTAPHSGPQVNGWLLHITHHLEKYHTYLSLFAIMKDLTGKSVLYTASREKASQNTSPQQLFWKHCFLNNFCAICKFFFSIKLDNFSKDLRSLKVIEFLIFFWRVYNPGH